MKIVKESLSFERGRSPKASMGIGRSTQIITWLDEMGVENYTINDDFTIDVNGDVSLSYNNLIKIPSYIKFRRVEGFFSCINNKLITLEGSPISVGEDFYCNGNHLTSLKGAPESVKGIFSCFSNRLTSLDGAPESIELGFYCAYNQLTSLEGAPSSVGDRFDCSNNKLTSLKGCPKNIEGDFYCSYNQLNSLENAPESVGGDFNCYNNPKKFTKKNVEKVCNVKGKIRL